PDEVRKKGPRGVIELTDCWISPSNEDDVTFTVQTASDIYKFRASDAKDRQKWIDKLRPCSGLNAAEIFVSSLSSSKTNLTNSSQPSNDVQTRSLNRRDSKINHHQQTLKEMKEVIRCVEDMLLLRSLSQSCISSLQDSLIILTRRRTPDHEPHPSSLTPTNGTQTLTTMPNLSGKQLSQSYNSGTSGRSGLSGGVSSQSNSHSSLNKTASLSGLNQSSSSNDPILPIQSLRGTMPGTMTEHENLLSLVSIEVLINQVHLDLNIECHFPCIVFRLLDYPAVSIPYFDQWQLEEFHNLKRNHPNLTWRQLLSDQFYELRSANGKFNFKRGKSCLFKTYFKTLYTHLLNVPLFLLLIDQINNKDDVNPNTTQFIGSCNIKLNELIEKLNQAITKNGNDIPLVEQETFNCTLFNLMGTRIGTCDVAVRFCHYGTTIVIHLPMFNDGAVVKTDTKAVNDNKEQINAPLPSRLPPPLSSSSPSSLQPTDTIVKHIHFVNGKKDVGLQLSRSDLPSSSTNNKSAQTRWTSTKSHPTGYDHSRGRYLRTKEDPLLDDGLITSYQPPPLYFNSDSDFLQMMTPTNVKCVDHAKENRLSYLASIPIASFNDDYDLDDEDDNNTVKHQQQPKSKTVHNVRFNLSSSSLSVRPSPSSAVVSQTEMISKERLLAKDFLHNFPLLRALVEEALALQEYEQGKPVSIKRSDLTERANSAEQKRQENSKPSSTRPKSAANIHSVRTKSVIVTRNINNTRRLYPPPPDTRQLLVTKNDVRNLVDRLSKPKFNKRLEREIALAKHMTTVDEIVSTPRLPTKPVYIQPTSTHRSIVTQKPPLSYGTTRAHRLYTEFARARRAAYELPVAPPPKSPVSPRKESSSNGRILPPPPQLLNTGTLSHFSLLNKVDIDSATIDRNSMQKSSSSDQLQPKTGSSVKSSSTTSYDASKELNQSSSSSESTPSEQDHLNNDKNDLAFSITDVTDYFTDGGNASSTRPSTRQST
ncbi:unnamed protein product, partial [Rotaria magnacalcarata]